MNRCPYQTFFEILEQWSSIPSREREFLRSHLTIKDYDKNTLLLEQGEVENKIFFILEGLLKTFYLNSKGVQFNKGFCSENEVCAPFVSILTFQPSNLNILSLEKTKTIIVQAKILKELYQRDPCWSQISRRITETLLIERETREYYTLMHTAKERYLHFLNQKAEIAERLPLYEIAAYLGITPVALSNVRKSLLPRLTF